MRTATEEWLMAARDDLETVGEIIDNPRLTHVLAFHTHSKSTSSLRSGAQPGDYSVTLLPAFRST